MKLSEAIEVLKKIKGWVYLPLHSDPNSVKEAIDTVVEEFCEHHWLPVGEWDGVMMMQCVKCNLYKEGNGERKCIHPYAFVYGGCGKPERCLRCGEILSD